jgi:CRP-like cAMP-binding protein
MKTIKQLDLNNHLIKNLLRHFEEKRIQVDQQIVYRGHIPFAGILLLDGQIVASNTRTTREFNTGALIGVKELMEGNPLKYTIEVKSGSTIMILDRTSLVDLGDAKDKAAQEIFLEITA